MGLRRDETLLHGTPCFALVRIAAANVSYMLVEHVRHESDIRRNAHFSEIRGLVVDVPVSRDRT